MTNMERVVNAVKEFMGDNYEVYLNEIRKNNGMVHQAVTIREQGGKVAPSFYIDSFLKAIESEEISIWEAAEEISGFYRERVNMERARELRKCINKEYVLEKVVYQLVNKEKNTDLLSRIPYKEFLDLAVIYRVIVEENDGYASMAVTNNLCDAYSISKDELDAAARSNTEKCGFYVSPISEVVKEMSDVPENIEKVPMWILTNSTNINGAAVMLYKKYFNDLAKQLESDLYVLPSSI